MYTISRIALVSTALTAVLFVSACDVKKTQEGNVTVPKFEVQKTQEGNVTVPKYEVTAPEVSVNSKQAEVTVPVVTTEKKTITVPTLDVKTGKEVKAEEAAKK